MGFLNPALFWSLTAIAVPIIIHLLNRFRFKRTVWAAMKFLLEAIEDNARRVQMQDIILLIIRVLVLALIALALVRPTLTGTPPAILEESKRAGVIILDNSYSMGYEALSQSRFDQAKAKTLEVLDSFKGGRAALILMSDRADAIVGAPSTDIRLLKQIVKSAEVSDGATALLPSIQKAFNIVENLKTPAREVYLITDCQAGGWRKNKEELQNLLAKLSERARIFLVNSGEGGSDHNLCVTDFRLHDSGVNIGETALFTMTVANYSSVDQTEVAVSVWIDNMKVDQKIIPSIGAGSSVTLPLPINISDAGWHRLRVELPGDPLMADNQRYLASEVFQGLQVLAVDGRPSLQKFRGEADFLQTALSPKDEEAPDQIFLFNTRKISAAELGGENLSDYDAVIMSNVASLDERSTTEIRSYVERGGALFMSLGSLVQPRFYNSLAEGEKPLLPARLKQLIGNPDGQTEPFRLSEQKLDHPVVSFFNNELLKGLILLPAYKAAWVLEPVGPEAVTILRFGKGQPALMEKPYGLGRVMLYASTAGLEWNDAPLTPFFLPLMRRGIEFLAEDDAGRRNILVHGPITEPLHLTDMKTRIIMSDPAGREKELAPVIRGENLFIDVDAALARGFYSFTVAADKKEEFHFAANVDTDESRLESLREEELRREFPGFNFEFLGGGEDVGDALKKRHSGAELWWPIMALAAILMILESCLAKYFGPEE